MDVTFRHGDIEVTILEGPSQASGRPTPEAVARYSSLADRLDEFRLFAADRLPELYPSTWLDDEIGVLDRRGFAGRLSEPRILLWDAPAAASVSFSDGDISGGHSIRVSLRDGVPSGAEMLG